MGSQQLLLIVVGTVLIGVMVVVGIEMFKDQASSTNRDAITNDLANYAVQAQKFYRRPTLMGGGGHSFNNLSLWHITKEPVNANATYVLSPDPGTPSDVFVRITGTGFNDGNDGATPVQVRVTVWSDSSLVEVMN